MVIDIGSVPIYNFLGAWVWHELVQKVGESRNKGQHISISWCYSLHDLRLFLYLPLTRHILFFVHNFLYFFDLKTKNKNLFSNLGCAKLIIARFEPEQSYRKYVIAY